MYTTSAHILLANYCYSSLKSAVSTVASVASQTTGPLPTNPKLVTLQPSEAANSFVYADVLQIRYQSTDTIVVNLMNATTVTNSAASSSPSATASVSQSSGGVDNSAVSTPSGTTSSALSTGAKAGIGVGVVLGIFALVGTAAFLFLRKRHRGTIKTSPTRSVDQDDQGAQDRKLAEMDAPGNNTRPEMDALVDMKRAEMDAGVIQEMPGSKVVTELSGQ